MLRSAYIAVAVLLYSGFALASPIDERVAAAQRCGVEKDYNCSFEILIDLAGNEDWPLADNAVGVEFISGAMLEGSLISASDAWSAIKTREAAERYLEVVYEKHPNLNIFYATGHGLRAMSCGEMGEVACRAESVSFLCANKGRLVAPMGGRPTYQEFANRLITILTEECGGF